MDSIESSKQANGLQVRKKTIAEAAGLADEFAAGIQNRIDAGDTSDRCMGERAAFQLMAEAIRALPVAQ